MENGKGLPVDTELRLGNTELHASSSMGIGTNEVGPPNILIYSGYPRQVNRNPKRQRDAERFCTACGATSTPLWRKGPHGRQTLCNACGLKLIRAQKKARSER
ncbi:white collar 2 type of transcription factor [Castilleja foliolosa]|uniref:White collar 2 type of transcription factor n=1 Tax=Castilleja foliolosa TaxID=1961234 RepID=A0ABD3BTL1_9LAMI